MRRARPVLSRPARALGVLRLASIAEFARRGFRLLLHVVGRRPVIAVPAPVPGVAVPTPPVRHDWDPPIGLSRELCRACFRTNPVGFHVPDAVWRRVVPPQLQGEVLCLDCFAHLADEKLIAWDLDIELFPVSLATHLGLDPGSVNRKPARMAARQGKEADRES